MDCSIPGFPAHHQLPELAQTHVSRVGDTIQSFHPLLFPSSLAFNLSSASGSFPVRELFPSAGQSIEVSASISVLPRNGNPLQYSCLENPMDGGAWWATLHGVAKSRTRLSDFTFTLTYYSLFPCWCVCLQSSCSLFLSICLC